MNVRKKVSLCSLWIPKDSAFFHFLCICLDIFGVRNSRAGYLSWGFPGIIADGNGSGALVDHLHGSSRQRQAATDKVNQVQARKARKTWDQAIPGTFTTAQISIKIKYFIGTQMTQNTHSTLKEDRGISLTLSKMTNVSKLI